MDKGDIEPSDHNVKQGLPLLDSSNVSASKMPLANDTSHQEEANSKIEKLPRTDQDATTLEHCKGDSSSWLKKAPLSEKNSVINNSGEQSENVSPTLQQYHITRPKTPPMPVSISDIFSPNTVKQVRSSIHALFPNGPPPPKPVIRVKRPKKGDIAGCAKRRRVTKNKSLRVFKEDTYIDNKECPAKRTYGKRKRCDNWSKSRFNPVSDEIAKRLKKDEKVDQRKYPSEDTKNTDPCISKPYTPRSQAFSPLPSTSKDSETIMKNEKQFNESLRYKNYDSFDDDDDDLPEIQWQSQSMSKTKRPESLLQSIGSEFVSNEILSVKSEDLNNNNDNTLVDLCEIQFEKYMPKKQYVIPESTNAATGNDPIIIDDIDYVKVVENSEPKRAHVRTREVIEIKDDYSSITYEDLHSVPKTTEPDDIDKVLKDLENYRQKHSIIISDIITIVDVNTSTSPKSHTESIPKRASAMDNQAVMIVPTQESTTTFEARASTKPVEIVKIPDHVPGIPKPRNRAAPQAPTNEVEFVSETILEDANNSTSCNDSERQSVMAEYFFGDLIRNHQDTDSQSEPDDNPVQELHSHFRFLIERHITSSSSRTKSQKKKSKKPKKPPQGSCTVNNENSAPSTNVQAESPVNEERRLGNCPICMDNLGRASIASTTCGHVFCLGCIKTYLRKLRNGNKKCPTCRKTLKGLGYHLVFL